MNELYYQSKIGRLLTSLSKGTGNIMEQKIKEKREKWNKKFKDSFEIESYSILTFRLVVAEILLDLDDLLEHKRNHCCSKKDRSAHDQFK